MTTRSVMVGSCVWLLSACGGEAANQPTAVVAATDPNAAVVVAPTEPPSEQPPALASDEVVGLWCQYWIPPAGSEAATPARRADSEQYLFLPDGRFGWRAEAAVGEEPRKRSGQWSVSGNAIVLTDTAGQALDQLVIADCPANPEAEQLDAAYRCRSLNGGAFWLRKPHDSVDASSFIP